MEDRDLSHRSLIPGFSTGFAAVLDFIFPLYTPIAMSLFDQNDLTEEEEDKKAEGAMGKLHTWLGKNKAELPKYPQPQEYFPPGAKGQVGKLFVAKCIVRYKGKNW